MSNHISRYLLGALIVILLLPSIVIGKTNLVLESPNSLKEVQELGETFSEKTMTELPGTLKDSWQHEVLPIWGRIWNGGINIFNLYIRTQFTSFSYKVFNFIEKEIKERKPGIEQEFKKEKQEMGEDIPVVSKSIWGRFKELIK